MRRITGNCHCSNTRGAGHGCRSAPRGTTCAPVYNWTGLYFGVNGGGAWGQQDPFNIITNRFDHVAINYSGGEVGGTAGAQIQVAHVVLGTEVDLDWAGVRGSSILTPRIFGNPLGLTFNATTNISAAVPANSAVRAPISGSAGQLEPALNMGLCQIAAQRLNIFTPPQLRWRPHASMRCALA